MSYRSETIKSAQYVKRPLSTGGNGISSIGHHGICVETDKGNSYLIHQAGPFSNEGLVCTPASNMSNKWSVDHDINVNGNHTVGDCMRYGASRIDNHHNSVQYWTSGTCIGTARRIDNELSGGGTCILI